MLALYFSPCLNWDEDFAVFVRSLSPLYVDYDAIFNSAKLERPTKKMVLNALPRLCKYRDTKRSIHLLDIQDEDKENLEPFLKVIETECGKTLRDNFKKFVYARAWNDLNCVITRFKAHFNVARPYQYDAQLDPVFRPGHPSFPSGHSTQAHVFATLVKLLINKKAVAKRVDALADSIALNREFAGVHYKFDSAAGKMVAACFVRAFLKHEDIKAEFEKLQALECTLPSTDDSPPE